MYEYENNYRSLDSPRKVAEFNAAMQTTGQSTMCMAMTITSTKRREKWKHV